MIDTLRADALGAYGSSKGDTPEINAFAEGAVSFMNTSTPRAKTTPAVASLMTGTYPPEHGVRDLGRPLPEALPTLAEQFAEAGWRTAAIVGNYVLRAERSGLERGFQSWNEELPDMAGSGVPECRATTLVDGAVEMLDSFGEERFFLYLHAMDPHGPYEPPLEHRVQPGRVDPLVTDEASAQRFQDPSVAEINVPADARLADGTIDVARVRAAYRGEVRYVDAELGRLFCALVERGLEENTIVILTSDHGESFGEHSYWFEHGRHAYEATCRVPLIVRAPGLKPARVQDLASLVDVAPTLTNLVGIDPLFGPDAAGPRGRDLFTTEPGYTYSEKAEGADLVRAMQIDAVRFENWNGIWRFALDDENHRRSLAFEMYDLPQDPSEILNLEGSVSPTARTGLEEARRLWREFDDQFDDAPKREPDSAELERLRAMGYVGR